VTKRANDINYIGTTGLLSLSPGSMDRPTVPPALIADIGGGSFPAVMNILLALIGREKSGKGVYLDIAMSDAMFTFAWLALATRFSSGKPVEPEKLRHFGGSPRYQLYPTGRRQARRLAARWSKSFGNPSAPRSSYPRNSSTTRAIRRRQSKPCARLLSPRRQRTGSRSSPRPIAA